MERQADAIVIGGGIMGLSTALHLSEQGAGRVLLLEKKCLAAGSTGKSGAILRQHYSHETTIRMARESLHFYASFAERTGQDIGFRRPGMAFLCLDTDRAALESNVGLQRALGVDTTILDAPALRDLEPRAEIGDDVIAAHEPEAGFVSPILTAHAFATILRERGVDVVEGATVTDVALDASGAVEGVKLADGTAVSSRVVVNTAGPWAGILCRRLGLDLPLLAIRPEQAFFSPPPDYGGEKLIFGDLQTGLYWKPEPAGWTRVGNLAYADDATVADPDDYDEGVSNAFLQDCRRRMAGRIPAYARSVSWGGCSALYTVTPDAHALIGAVPGIDGLYLASGFSGHGFKMAPAVGRGLAACVTGADPGAFDASFFAVDRFARGAAVTSSYEYGILG